MGHGLATLSTGLAGSGLTWLFQSSALLALGLLAGRIVRRSGPAVQSAVYRTALAAVLVAPAASTLLAWAGFDGLTLRLPSPAEGGSPATVPIASATRPKAGEPEASAGAYPVDPQLGVSSTPAVPIATARVASSTHVEAGKLASPPRRARTSPRGITTAAIASAGLAAWMIGAGVLGLRLWVGQRRMGRLRASAIRAEPAAEGLCRELAGRMGLAAPSVLRSPFLFSPCLDGLRRPAILLPEDVADNLHETFVHELAHLARHDGLWNLLRRSAVSILWFQPLLWALSRRLEVTAEEVCDDFVVQFGADRARYAGHLLDLAGRALPRPSPTGVGMVSFRSLLGRRVVRILDATRPLSTRAGRRAVLATLAAGLAGTLLAGLLGVGGARREAQAQTKAPTKHEARAKAEPAADADVATIRGQVVGPDGAPVAGATVIASRVRIRPDGIGGPFDGPREHEIVRKAADRDGRFVVAFATPGPDATIDPMSPRYPQFGQVIAIAPGYGVGYHLKGKPIRLSRDDVPIDGRIVDLEGRPAAGVTVRLRQLNVLMPGARGGVDRGDKAYEYPNEESIGLDPEPLLPGGLVTDADGRFRIVGLGRESLAWLEISGPKVALKRVKVVTRSMGRVAEDPMSPDLRGLDDPGLYGADCTIAVEPSRPIEGVVRDAATDEPIPGTIVTAHQLAGSTLLLDGHISAEADARGRYRLVGLPKGNGHKLAVYPPLDRPYFITRGLEVAAGPGLAPVRFDVPLRRGIWITGKVTDARTGKPARASVDYFPFLANARARDYPNFDPDVTSSIAIEARYRTDPEGRFRIVGLPGRGVVTAHTDDRSYRVGVGAESIAGRTEHQLLLTYDHISPALYQGLKQVDVPEGALSTTCDLALDPGGSVRVRLVDEAGTPVTGATASGRFPPLVDDGDHSLHDESVARVVALEAGLARTVLFRHRERKLGAVLNLPPDGPRDDAEVTTTLRPCATLIGRLVDSRGRPVAGRVEIWMIVPSADAPDSGEHWIAIDEAKPDAEGRFRCEGIPPGGRLIVRASDGHVYGMKRMAPQPFEMFDLIRDLTAAPAQMIDLGTFDVDAARRIDAPAEKAASGAEVTPKKPGPIDVPINGRIIDLEGRPVAGISVTTGSFQSPKGGDLTPWLERIRKGEPPWIAGRDMDWDREAPASAMRAATTDRDGQFRIEGIGAERVVTLKLKGDSIAFTTIEVATRVMEPILARGYANHHGPGKQTIYGAEFTYTAAPSRPIEGVVKDARTDQALADAEIRSYGFAGSDFVGIMDLLTRTDAQGRFRLMGMPKGRKNTLLVVPNDEQPYFLQEVELADPPGAGPLTVEIAAHRGIWIEGKLTEQATGKPVPDAWLHYLPFLANTYAQSIPVFDKNGNTDGTGFQDRYKTKADGSFRVVGLPGRAIVGAIDYGRKYLQGVGSESIKGLNKAVHFETYRNPVNPGKLWPTVMKEIDPPSDAETVHLDLQVITGPSVRLRLVDAEDKPVTGASTRGLTGRSSYEREKLTGAEAGATNLMPDEERIVLVCHEGRKIGKVVRVRKGDDANGPVVVTLEPLAELTGRVADADGNPVSNARVRPDVLPSGDFGLSLSEVVTGADGRFRVPDLPTGCDYGLAVASGEAIKNRRYTHRDKAAVKPGETTDVGEIRFKND